MIHLGCPKCSIDLAVPPDCEKGSFYCYHCGTLLWTVDLATGVCWRSVGSAARTYSTSEDREGDRKVEASATHDATTMSVVSADAPKDTRPRTATEPRLPVVFAVFFVATVILAIILLSHETVSDQAKTSPVNAATDTAESELAVKSEDQARQALQHAIVEYAPNAAGGTDTPRQAGTSSEMGSDAGEHSYQRQSLVKAKQGDYETAVYLLDKAIQLEPGVADLYTDRGIYYCHIGKFDQAVNDLSKAIQLNPRSAKAYHNRGVVHTMQSDYDVAIEDFDKAIELDPSYSLAHSNRALAIERKLKKDRGSYGPAGPTSEDDRRTIDEYLPESVTVLA
jgi:tetratricopeptide (TPR) repeat protein